MIHPLDLTGKRILITGASQGLGATIAHIVSTLGASVVLVSRRTDVLQKIASTLHVSLPQQKHQVMPFDLQNTADIPAFFDNVYTKCGTCDGLVHSAGLQPIKALRYLREQDLHDTFIVGVEAGRILAQTWASQLIATQQEGSLVWLSSVAAYAGQPGLSTYSASKGAIEALTRQFARQWLCHRIRVNSVVAGQVSTDSAQTLQQHLTEEQWEQFRSRHPLGFGEPSDIAYAVSFLLSQASRWITGTHLVVDGGYLAQ